MGIRFNKSVKICKGVRLNLSKTGVSMSLGVKGATVNVGKKGVRGTVGIPGTGVSYTTSLNKLLGGLFNKVTGREEPDVELRLNDQGKVEVVDGNGKVVTDAAALRKIRATDEYKQEKARLEEEHKQQLQEQFDAAQQEMAVLLNPHWMAPTLGRRSRFADEQVISAADEVEIEQAIDEWIGQVELPVEINVDYQFNGETGELMVDMDLPEIEDLPDTELTQTAGGQIKEKAKTQTKLRTEYANLVHSLAVYVAGSLMNLSPAIAKVVLSAYTQRRSDAGDMGNDYILSVRFERSAFEGMDMQDIEPVGFCGQFENRRKLSSTMIFKSIEPYE